MTKFGCEVKIRSIQKEDELSRSWFLNKLIQAIATSSSINFRAFERSDISFLSLSAKKI